MLPVAALLGLLVLAPLAMLLWYALQADTAHWAHLATHVLPQAFANTVMLLLGVGTLTALLGTGSAWLVTAYDFPGRRALSWALLLPLAANGGATRTHALSPASPALERGSNPNALATDQRGVGYVRDAGPGTDIGAYEAQGQGTEPVALPGLRSWGALALAAILALLGVHRVRRQIDRSRAKGS